MDWKALSPYVVPLLVAALLLRRAMRAQKPRTVRTALLWIFPAILLIVTALALAREPVPGIAVFAGFLAAGTAGGAFGWFRVHTLEFSLDAESGKVTARATRLGALLIAGLVGLRYAADLAFKNLGWNAGTSLVRVSDAVLIFSTAMLVARGVHTWIRARALLAGRNAAAGAESARPPPAPG